MSTYFDPLNFKVLNSQIGQSYNVVSLSGGKDSTALALLAIERNTPNLFGVFADTGNELHPTYDYVRYLEKVLDMPIYWVKADFSQQIAAKRKFIANDLRHTRKYKTVLVFDKEGQPVWKRQNGTGPIVYKEVTKKGVKTLVPVQQTRKIGGGHKVRWTNKAKRRALAALHPTGIPFLDLCLWKGRFPSTKARFCSEELKREVILYQVQFPLLEQGYQVISWQGVRADESPERANLPESDAIGGVTNYRPILQWTVEDVFAMHDKYGIAPNPLYKQGMGRVGCVCIHARKAELAEISNRYPLEITRIEEWEWQVSQSSKRGKSTFFSTPDGRGDGIREVVEWAKTTRGGKQYDLLSVVNIEEISACSSIYGLCE
jgi:3'-phosphoadenosine 5'-phosphosulfate sulfotransferase (PAPS reductase)/FAD synthetase